MGAQAFSRFSCSRRRFLCSDRYCCNDLTRLLQRLVVARLTEMHVSRGVPCHLYGVPIVVDLGTSLILVVDTHVVGEGHFELFQWCELSVLEDDLVEGVTVGQEIGQEVSFLLHFTLNIS